MKLSSKGSMHKGLNKTLCMVLTTACVCNGIVGNTLNVSAMEQEKETETNQLITDNRYKDFVGDLPEVDVHSVMNEESMVVSNAMKSEEDVLEQERQATLELVKATTEKADKANSDKRKQERLVLEEKERIKREKELERQRQLEAKNAEKDNGGADFEKSNNDEGTSLTPAVVDPNYTGTVVKVTGNDRDILERLVMGEAGGEGFLGACLVAQCIRDTMVEDNVRTVEQVRRAYGYTGSLSRTPNSDVLRAVKFIFDEGGYAVKHKIHYFYAYQWCTSSWHETQLFVIQHGGHRFFDRR